MTADVNLEKDGEFVAVDGKHCCESAQGCEFRGKEKGYKMFLLDFDDVSLI
jgi:hypothetical protein